MLLFNEASLIHFCFFQTIFPLLINYFYLETLFFPEVLSFYMKFPDFRKFPEKWQLCMQRTHMTLARRFGEME